MPSVLDGHLAVIGRPHHHMGCAGAYLVVAAGAAIGLERSRSGHRPHLVVASVRPGLQPGWRRQWRKRLLPAR